MMGVLFSFIGAGAFGFVHIGILLDLLGAQNGTSKLFLRGVAFVLDCPIGMARVLGIKYFQSTRSISVYLHVHYL